MGLWTTGFEVYTEASSETRDRVSWCAEKHALSSFASSRTEEHPHRNEGKARAQENLGNMVADFLYLLVAGMMSASFSKVVPCKWFCISCVIALPFCSGCDCLFEPRAEVTDISFHPHHNWDSSYVSTPLFYVGRQELGARPRPNTQQTFRLHGTHPSRNHLLP
ncbi:hypothetical protein MPTK1_5g10590 [Marchantia polymorpha subsp. ruderalis]|uniref:Uncharacterized protein n=2 Tax=Marchantia polymorpha TaxID=3197 RepID=A0AAF6BH02_MARPO|nr:hypothetical protein MARPO_0048s0013 [Marchantia polymorpha]BBN11286.1 hypothetical protein Mp_5g10590 [Marchantia polymorpha subsp. ruderalis]|eukprot:PTQ38885.1 hypothetical protein MARPO_0048s0013 [Marchantia polymorpha]